MTTEMIEGLDRNVRSEDENIPELSEQHKILKQNFS